MSMLKPSEGDGDVAAVLRRKVVKSPSFDSDLDLAFRLQLHEAMAASLSVQSSSSTQFPSSMSAKDDVPSSSHSQTLALEQELLNLDFIDQETKKSQEDILRWIHDRKVAEALENIPEDEWKLYGEDFQRPYGKDFQRPYGEGSSVDSELFRVYSKGLLGQNGEKFSGIGVAICDSRDELMFEMRKPVKITGEWMNNRVIAGKALIEGLSAALDLGLKSVVYYCDYYPLIQFVTHRWQPKQRKLAMLLNQVELLQKKFTFCRPSYVAQNDIKFAFKLAREAIISQTDKSSESSATIIESCVICLEDVDAGHIFSVDDCKHRYCFSCMKQHVEVKLLHAILPKCPHEGCTSELKIDSCKKFLTPKLIEIMNQRLTEAAIPVTEKIYCPYPRCSALMSRTEVLENSKYRFANRGRPGVRKCIKCNGLFCVICKVPWHTGMTCFDYKFNNFNQPAEEAKLKTLAAKNLWRQCVKCNHMIELAKGCFHMTCRCGYEFCYTCGSEWKDKKPTCTCPLWDNQNIIDDEDHFTDDDTDDEDDEDEEEWDSDEYDEDYY